MIDDTNFHVKRERWAELDIIEQMANISSEVGRAITAHKSGKTDQRDSAINRALELFALTADIMKDGKTSYRLHEILRARDEFLSLFYNGTFETDADAIDAYFTVFAMTSRLRHRRERINRSVH